MSNAKIIIRVPSRSRTRVVKTSDDMADYRTEICFCRGDENGHTHRQRIPVGMSDAAWQAELARRLEHSKRLYANWVARRIAQFANVWAHKIREGHAKWVGTPIRHPWQQPKPGDHLATVRDVILALQDSHALQVKAGIYGVPRKWLRYCALLAQELAMRKVEARP